MSLSEQFDVGQRILAELSLENTAITQTSNAAAGSTTGETIDRNAYSRRYYSAKSVVSGAFIGGGTSQTGSIAPQVQHSSDGTSWDNYTTAPAAVSFTGTTEKKTVSENVSLNGARRYVRVTIPAPTFSDCSSGSLFNVHGVLVLGGGDELPATT